jgi:hypothetical protein
VPELTDVERDLQALATELQRLEAAYNMYFAGRLPRPPLESRSRVDATFKRLERSAIEGVALRFRYSTLQARYAAFTDLWERGVRAREEGRTGPFATRARAIAADRSSAGDTSRRARRASRSTASLVPRASSVVVSTRVRCAAGLSDRPGSRGPRPGTGSVGGSWGSAMDGP